MTWHQSHQLSGQQHVGGVTSITPYFLDNRSGCCKRIVPVNAAIEFGRWISHAAGEVVQILVNSAALVNCAALVNSTALVYSAAFVDCAALINRTAFVNSAAFVTILLLLTVLLLISASCMKAWEASLSA